MSMRVLSLRPRQHFVLDPTFTWTFMGLGTTGNQRPQEDATPSFCEKRCQGWAVRSSVRPNGPKNVTRAY